MSVLIGIDEAGYGPLLGPLVVSSVVLDIPEEHLRADLWKLLKTAVSPDKKKLAGRLLITDSKKAYTPAAGVGHLRKTVLACLQAAAPDTALNTAAELLQALDAAALSRAKTYTWYENIHTQPLGSESADIGLSAAVLRNALQKKDIRLIGLKSRCLDVAWFNSKVEKVRNKSRVLFTELCSLILDALNNCPDPGLPLQVIVDRQGGRINYHQELLRMFPGASLTVLRQDPKISSYELIYKNKTVKVHFCIKADLKYLPVCLASMTSKYLREVLMEAQNDWFCRLCPQLKPTAGYWEDGKRFLDDLAQELPAFTFDRKQLIRML